MRRRPTWSAPLPPGARALILDVDGEPHLVISFHAARPVLPASLTDAERSIAHLLLSGLSNKEIAAARGRSESTISKQITRLFRKLGVGSRAELAARLPATCEQSRRSSPRQP